jgi:hypothetical protein
MPEASEAKRFVTKQMKEKLGDISDIAEKIIPTNFGIGCRRLTVSKCLPLKSFTKYRNLSFSRG